MRPKPKGWSQAYGSVFGDRAVVDAYHLRPPYPEETFAVLAELSAGGVVLDAGCGPGDIARRLAPRVTRVDAVDVSAPMIEHAVALPGAAARNLRWILGRIEDVVLDPPYALAVAGDSIHWFDWEVALPRLADVLAPDGLLAIVHRDWLRVEHVRELLRPIYARHSWNADFSPLDPVTELRKRGLFEHHAERTTAAEPWRPTLDEIVSGHFSMSGFAPDRIRDPAGFAAELREAVAAALEPRDGRYDLDVAATVVWGRATRVPGAVKR